MVWKNDQVSEKETEKIVSLAKKCLEIQGDYVEMGCYKGDTSLLLAEVIKDSAKKLWVYDSFEGLPDKSELDESIMGESFQRGTLLTTKREVKERFLRAGLRVPVIKKAWFKDLTEADLPEKIALAFLDGDFYESIRDSLKLVIPRMSKEGVLIVHDYTNPALPGVRKAVDEWINKMEFQVVLM
ncbi:class I SAM-dependent methyltransferase [Candidatus Saccharibacteria bacterium]|nr:class I SAM-dependent methyltransferase [Candidatus Saccharibacteria bacterium]